VDGAGDEPVDTYGCGLLHDATVVAVFPGLALGAGAGATSLGSTTELGLTGASFSVDTWVYIFAHNTSPAGQMDNAILGTHSVAPLRGLHMVVRSAHLYCGFYHADLEGTKAIPAREWHHVAFTYDRARGRQAIYVDGELDAAAEGRPPLAHGNVNLADYVDRGLNGALSELRIWHRALTADEVARVRHTPAVLWRPDGGCRVAPWVHAPPPGTPTPPGGGLRPAYALLPAPGDYRCTRGLALTCLATGAPLMALPPAYVLSAGVDATAVRYAMITSMPLAPTLAAAVGESALPPVAAAAITRRQLVAYGTMARRCPQLARLRRMARAGTGCDVVLRANDPAAVAFPAHSAVLAAASPYWETALWGDWPTAAASAATQAAASAQTGASAAKPAPPLVRELVLPDATADAAVAALVAFMYGDTAGAAGAAAAAAGCGFELVDLAAFLLMPDLGIPLVAAALPYARTARDVEHLTGVAIVLAGAARSATVSAAHAHMDADDPAAVSDDLAFTAARRLLQLLRFVAAANPPTAHLVPRLASALEVHAGEALPC